MIAAGISSAAVIGLTLAIAGSLLMGPAKPKPLGTQNTDRLYATLVPTTPRKIAFGITALDTDVRYQAYTGTNQAYLDQIVCHASHEVHSIDEIWLDNELAWSAAGGVQGRYVGYLTVTTRTVGTSSNGIAIDGTWTSSCTLTGCAYTHLQYKLTGNSSSAQSPFASGVTSRMTVRGHGAKIYDPRLDSTVTGGSGSQRATDQTTWAWDDNASRNPALQELFYELGWKINGKLAVGKGVPSSRIDLASYAVAANHCDESITLNGGGTEPRYRCDGIISEADDPSAARDNLCWTMNAMLRDAGGKLSLAVIVNDLGTPVTPAGKSSFDHSDVQSEIGWEQTPDLSSTFNVVRGQRVDPSNTALYQMVDYPDVTLTSNDGIDRIDTFNLQLVQSNGQAQRLAKQRLQRSQYQGKLTFTGQPSFWGLSIGDVFPLSLQTFGWSSKLFRVASQKISRTGATEITAVEENSAIYQWDNNEGAAVIPGAPTVYDPLNSPILLGISEAAASAGTSVAVVYLYKRAASAPPVPSTTSTFTFSTGVLTGFDNGWSQSVPAANGNPLYVTVATASNSGSTDTIATGEWAAPVIMAQDGTNGSNGSNGIQAATVFLYRRAASTPAVPSVTTTYTFSSGVLSGINNGWSQTVPSTDGNPCYVTTATALVAAPGTTDTIGSGEWASPTVLAQDGASGSPGANALSVTAVPDTVSVPCFANGTPKAALTGFQMSVLSGTTDITATATYTFAASGVTGVAHTGGAFTVAGLGSDTGYVDVTVNSLVTKRVVYSKSLDGQAYNTVEDDSIGVPGTSYTDIGDVTILSGPAGTYTISYQVDAVVATSSTGADGYVDYSLDGGSTWTTMSGSSGTWGPANPGDSLDIFHGFSPSGSFVSAKQNVLFRLMMRRTGSGTLTGVGGSFMVQWTA